MFEYDIMIEYDEVNIIDYLVCLIELVGFDVVMDGD